MSTSTDTSAASTISANEASVDDLCDLLARTQEEDSALLCQFARLFFAKVPRQLLKERQIEELGALTIGAFRFLQESRPELVNVQVQNPEEEGWEAPVTLIRAEVGDRPFIVDTIREYLSAENIAIQHYIYPVLRVQRDESGRIVEIGEPSGGNLEALIHCEISKIDDPERQRAIQSEIERRLADVVSSTSDFKAMISALHETMDRVRKNAQRFPDRAQELEETDEFLRWLEEDNFVFLGSRTYDIEEVDGERYLRVEPDSGLGILSQEEMSTYAGGVRLSEVPEELRRRIVGGPVLIVSKTNAESTVHRRARMDYIGIKKLDAEGRVVGERRFLGLFTSKAYAEPADAIPILRRKLEGILEASGAPPGSHDYKEIITIFNSMPKEDLFQASTHEMEREVETVLNLLFADQVSVTFRPDPLGRGVSVMVILPRGKFSGDVRHRIQDALTRRLNGTTLNYHLAMSAGDQARLHFYLSAPADSVERVTPAEVERDIHQIIRSWEDRLQDDLGKAHGAAEAQRLTDLYGPAFSDEYRAATLPEVAVRDVEQIERMRSEEQRVSISLGEPRGRGRAEDFSGVTVLKLYLRDERLVLSDFMPILENAGVRVVEVTPFTVTSPDLPAIMIYAFAVQNPEGGSLPLERADALEEALLAVRAGDTPNDPFNALVLRAGMRWREVDVLRTYANYAFQIGAVPTRYGPARALARHPDASRLLVEYFRARFDPDGLNGATSGVATRGVDALRGALFGALDAVDTLADDRALRAIVRIVDATTRTNYFQNGGADPTRRSGGVPYISLKIRCADVDELRRTRLLFEIFVFSSRMEGIHLRGAPVSRGGIRWSDRPDDFRTEVLGLVQTQIVKNAVIVPAGSKGGFITKRAFADREEMGAEVAEQYQTLIRGMLDLTDNLVDGEIVPPHGVVRYDEDDPYLVVAADKGTAHLSDVANALSEEYGFWMGDAFASGGSHGYDHKKQGITARGAWECVRRHFREMGKDIQAEPFTVVGIGDMSGDVFGNGMLLSRQIRLVAAFDHRDVFIDPDPDPATSFAERERLFKLPRSSWDDYDRSKLSEGAMIVPRASKEVDLTPEAKAALGIAESVERLDGEALIRAVLAAPVELLWNGGIGTYVKEREETNADAGNTANDPVRINAGDLRCKVVGEGGNLGFTQRARIAYALAGGRINTDALDNSAGVDMSDHEVNLKILLNPIVSAGGMDLDARNELLGAMTNEVSTLVLRNNIGQSLAVSLDEARSREALGDFTALISAFERDKLLERGAEGIPSSDAIHDRARDGLGLTRPTLCVLLAYAKLQAKAHLLDSPLPDDPATANFLTGYFPREAVRAAGADRLQAHRLRREIISTELVNELVDLMGSSFLHRLVRDTGRDLTSVIHAWYVASQISGAAEIRADLARLEGEYPAASIYRWLFGLARVLERTTRWALANLSTAAPTAAMIEEHLEGLTRLRADFTHLVAGEDRELFMDRMQELKELGLDDKLAARMITLRFLPELLDILRIAREAETDAVETARAYYIVSEQLGCAALQQTLRGAAGDDPWEKRLAQTLMADVGRAHRSIARTLLTCQVDIPAIQECLDQFVNTRTHEVQIYREVLEELHADDPVPLAGCAVAVRVLTELAET
ncbi:MAG TPA: NAD-glutamate dehydrogenase [Longimicrobiaceae bacterium]|nr:NAD-glutamate dehydrogenase [Longimicrobiaceae bacterium]